MLCRGTKLTKLRTELRNGIFAKYDKIVGGFSEDINTCIHFASSLDAYESIPVVVILKESFLKKNELRKAEELVEENVDVAKHVNPIGWKAYAECKEERMFRDFIEGAKFYARKEKEYVKVDADKVKINPEDVERIMIFLTASRPFGEPENQIVKFVKKNIRDKGLKRKLIEKFYELSELDVYKIAEGFKDVIRNVIPHEYRDKVEVLLCERTPLNYEEIEKFCVKLPEKIPDYDERLEETIKIFCEKLKGRIEVKEDISGNRELRVVTCKLDKGEMGFEKYEHPIVKKRSLSFHNKYFHDFYYDSVYVEGERIVDITTPKFVGIRNSAKVVFEDEKGVRREVHMNLSGVMEGKIIGLSAYSKNVSSYITVPATSTSAQEK